MKIHSLLRRWQRQEDGVTATEFAVIAPVLLTLWLGTVETVNYVWANSKVEDAAGIVGDLVAQHRSMTDTQLKQVLEAATMAIEPLPTNGMDLYVASVIACPCGGGSAAMCYKVLWSRKWSIGQPAPTTWQPARQPFTVNGTQVVPASLALQTNDTLIFTEAQYNYAAASNFQFFSPTIKERTYFRPRVVDRVSMSTGDHTNDFCDLL